VTAEPGWVPATEIGQSRACQRVGCGREFKPAAPGDIFCSSRCAGLSARAVAVAPLDLEGPDDDDDDGLVQERPAPAEPPAAARVCAFGPCDKPVLRPGAHVGWYSKFCSRDHASAAKAQREQEPTPARPAKPTTRATAGRDGELRRRYFDLLMDKAAAEDPPSKELLDRIERLLEELNR
jgi:hypothetical protein